MNKCVDTLNRKVSANTSLFLQNLFFFFSSAENCKNIQNQQFSEAKYIGVKKNTFEVGS